MPLTLLSHQVITGITFSSHCQLSLPNKFYEISYGRQWVKMLNIMI